MCKKMELNADKIIRGQVWFVREDPNVTKALRDAGSYVINGDRPYFVINVNGNMITCCPLTTNIGGSDTLSNDIVFEHQSGTGGGYSASRIIISQIQTKNIFEFEKYLYMFDIESTERIMNAVRNQIGLVIDTPKKTEDHQGAPNKDDILEDAKKQATLVLPSELIDKLELRLKGPLKKTEAIFRTEEEAAVFLNKWGTASGKEIGEYFGITIDRAYSWKYRAREKARHYGE